MKPRLTCRPIPATSTAEDRNYAIMRMHIFALSNWFVLESRIFERYTTVVATFEQNNNGKAGNTNRILIKMLLRALHKLRIAVPLSL